MARFDTDTLDAELANRLMTALITPRPIAWIVTQDRAGNRNAAPFSFFNILCSWPPIVAVGIQSRPGGAAKNTRANIEALGEFVVNLVPAALTEAMNATSAPAEPGVDELALAGLDILPSTYVAPPRIAGSPVALECRLRQSIAIGADRAILLGDVLATHVSDRAVVDRDRCRIDATALDLIARMHGRGMYLQSTDLFTLPRPLTENQP